MIKKLKKIGVNILEDVKIHAFIESGDEAKQDQEKHSLICVELEKIHKEEEEEEEDNKQDKSSDD